MTQREKIKKQHQEIISKAIDEQEIADDSYACDGTLVLVALEYAPIKVLKEIFKKYE